jgi:D-3-phosphoglycerate dehydrogenase
MTKPIVLLTEPIAEEGLKLLAESCELCTPWLHGRAFSAEELSAAHAIIVRRVQVTTHLLSMASNLRVIGRHGTGLDNVDLQAASARGIPVVFTPSVASHN